MLSFANSLSELEKLANSTDSPLALDWSAALLGLSDDEIEAKFEALYASPAAERLRQVTLNNNMLSGGFVMDLLVKAPFISQLERLFARDNTLNDESMEVLAKCDQLESLETLNLGGNYLGGDAVELLAEASWLPSLRSLDLSVNWVTTDGLEALVGGDEPLSLVSLTLGPNMAAIGDEGAKAIAESPNLPDLDQLILTNNDIGDAGAAALSQKESLQFLTLTNKEDVWHADQESRPRNNITDEGALALANSPIADNLRELFLSGNPISDEAGAKLRDSLNPDCDLLLD